MEEQKRLVPVFTPALAPLLLRAEQLKGSPLDRAEVLEIRDGASCVMMTVEDAQALQEKRGYRDLDPERCWEEWRSFRSELLGAEAAADPEFAETETESVPNEPRDEPLFMALDTDDPEYLRTIDRARASLDEFRLRIEACRTSRNVPCVKVRIEGGGRIAYLWLANARPDGDDFIAEVFEAPGGLAGIKVGDSLSVPGAELLDWMVNEDGVLHGGFSLRYQRSLLPEERHPWFDQYIGAERYA
jgi:uncharacterized protein YegJ (DUF2314 family)